jgi:hypothetical protein
LEVLVIDLHGDNHDNHAQHGKEPLTPQKKVGTIMTLHGHHGTGAIHDHDAKPGQ